MGLVDNIRRYIRGEDYEDENYDDFVDEEPEAPSQRSWPSFDSSRREDRQDRMDRADRQERQERQERAAAADTRSRDDLSALRSNRVVNIHTVTQLSVVLVKPEKYENAAEVADHLKDKRTVVLNLEQTNRDIARRLLDFLSGVAYANEGKIKKVANSTYIITPYNVDIQGDLIDELENNGLYL